MTEPTDIAFLNTLFPGDGEMAHLMRSHDWSQTPLGPVEHWPQSLRTTVSILLSTRHPMVLFWGDDLVQFYNDGYRPSLGEHKHPQALGQRGIECWAEIWHIIGPQIQSVMTRGEETWHTNQLVPFDRNGYFEEIYFTYSYSPVRDETGGVGGTLVVCTETTQQVLNHRRLQTLRELGANGMKAKNVETACQLAIDTLSANPHDIPFALLYLTELHSQQIRLVGATGVEMGTEISPVQINLSENDQWGLSEVCKTRQVTLVEHLASRFQALPVGIWDTPASAACIIPITQPGQDNPIAGLLVMGISPRRKFDDSYQGFFDLLASNIATAMLNASAYEAERQRAEALAEIDRVKTTFFSNISHEFRTPLTLMLAPLEDALASLNQQEQVSKSTDAFPFPPPIPPSHSLKEQLQIVQRNGRRLLKLVNTLLDFSRIEAGRIQAVYEPTDLAAFTAELSSTFRSLIERAGMSLIVECSPLSEPVYVDREMWEKIVLNLLSNAFKFTLTGTIVVRLQNSQNQVELAIEDTGIGIPLDEIPHLFERFHRVKHAQGRSLEGSGIGLSLVQELVKLHGGKITVTSQPGRGSCFTVIIPTGSAHLPADRIGATHTLASTAMGATPYIEEAWGWLTEGSLAADGKTDELDPFSVRRAPFSEGINSSVASASKSAARILVVDDNADMREYIRRLLEPHYRVETASDGVEALAAIRCQLPDLVLTDVMMPQLDGFGLLKALRSNASTRELLIILLSARAGEEARVEGLAAGADDYLIKPFSSRELMARVEASLKMVQIRKEAALREQALRLVAEQAQQETTATFKQLTQILETMSDAFVALDREWRITYQNAAAEKINNGKPRNRVLGKTHWEEWPDSVGTELEYQYRRAMAEQIAVHLEYHYYFPPKFDVWLEIHAHPSGSGLGIFFRDITKRKQAEATLRENQLQLQRQLAEIETIYQSAPIGLNVLDTNLRFVRINQRLAEINGLSVEAHLGRTVRQVLPELADEAERLLRPILETGKPLLNVEINGETPAQPGVQRTWLESFLPLKDGDRVIGINTVCEEITERKRIEAERQKAEESLRQAKEELEIRVAERTAALHQTIHDLQDAEEHIKVSLREKEVLLKEIHHRVKNNLGIVSSLLQMQIRRVHDPQLNIILQDSQNRIASIALVHEKLYRSDDLANINLAQYIQDLTVYLFDSYNISSNQIKLNVQVENVYLDIERVIPCGLIINELVSNALKHAFPGDRAGEIQVRFTQSSQSVQREFKHISTLIVQDNGIGLSQDFDIKKAKTLGLVLVQGLVKQIGATLEINSQQGTEFKITLTKPLG